jgi:hypothetical protein
LLAPGSLIAPNPHRIIARAEGDGFGQRTHARTLRQRQKAVYFGNDGGAAIGAAEDAKAGPLPMALKEINHP